MAMERMISQAAILKACCMPIELVRLYVRSSNAKKGK